MIIEPFTNAVEDSRLGNNSRVCVGTVAENVETENIKRRANFKPFRNAMLNSTMSRVITNDYKGFIGRFCTGDLLIKLQAQKQAQVQAQSIVI